MMIKKYFNPLLYSAIAATISLSGCKDDSGSGPVKPDETDARWVTLSGALMQTTAGDGNGGTMVYSISAKDAMDPNVSVDVFEKGTHIKSSRTARLQASEDGSYLYNIQYTGDDGGIFNKYKVYGGNDIRQEGNEVATATYVGTSPRWVIAAEGIGVAVHVTGQTTITEGDKYKYTRGTARMVSLDLNNPRITEDSEFPLALSAEDEAAGYYINRIDAPVLNKAKNKVFIGAAVSKFDPNSFTLDATGQRVYKADATRGGTKTLVVDYPSLTNAKIITSTKTTGNNNGYRSTMQYVGADGHVYQATHGEGIGNGGSKILRINSATNDYDNAYVFNLDQALNETDTYIETWKYVGNGIGYVIYSLVKPNASGTGSSRTGGYIARVDLNAKTATKMNIPNGASNDFGQHQNIAVSGDYVFIPVTPIGENGVLYVFNRITGEMKSGAKLVNRAGNRYIGVY